MKRFLFSIIAPILLSGCAAFSTAVIGDDLYTAHSRTEIAEQQKAAAEAAQIAAQARQAAWEAKLAEARALAAESEISSLSMATPYTNSFDDVLADDYQSAYARRLNGFASPSYKMPSSYYTYRYTDAYQYATAYDPAFYNIMVSGDQVWVEPKYITSMFGSWGASVVVPSYSWYYGWSRPSYSWWYGYPRYSWYDWGYGSVYDPYWGWSWGFGWGGYPYHPGFIPPYYHHHYYPPHYGGGSHRRPSVAHRPNSSQPGGRPAYLNGGHPSAQSGVGGSRPQYRGQSGTVTGSGQYRGSSSSRGSYDSQSRDSGTRTSNSFNQRNDNNSFRTPSSSSSSGRGYSGGYSGGGNFSGGSHGGGQGRR
jgi:uncharacterized membrane protein YgcG